MRSKLFTRVIAALSAMTMAVTMMMTSASAADVSSASWNMYRQNRGNGTYSTYGSWSGHLYDGTYNHATCQVNCTSFYTERPADRPAAYAQYSAFISSDKAGENRVNSGLSTRSYYNTSGYTTYNLLNTVNHGQYLQCRTTLINYANVNNCSISGTFKW